MPADPRQISLGLIGMGKMGGFHLSKALNHPGLEWVGVYDTHPDTAVRLKEKPAVRHYHNLNDLLLDADAVIIASPTATHFDLASRALRAGVDVLLEKPVAETTEQAEELLRLASTYERILQVGYLERYRVEKLRKPDFIPKLIVSERLNSAPGRESSVDVIADLMIHDLDLILALVGEEPLRAQAWGKTLRTQTTDEAEAHLVFPSGVRARLVASRVSTEKRRVLTLENELGRHVIDLDRNTRTEDLNPVVSLTGVDPLADQLDHFIGCVSDRRHPRVDGLAGLRTLRLVHQLQQSLLPSIDLPLFAQRDLRKDV